jgi:antitoxin PrlF
MQLHYHKNHQSSWSSKVSASAILDAESTLTERYQTTVPEPIRRALGLGKRDKIRYQLQPTGEVVISRLDMAAEEDPVLGSFLAFVARDMATHPERLQVMDRALIERAKALVAGVQIDLDSPLSAEDE